MSQYQKLIILLESIPRVFINLLINKKSNAIALLSTKENLIDRVWKRCLMVFIIMIKSKKIQLKTLFTVMSLQENKWTTFLDKLNSSNQNILDMLHMNLFQILLQELILKEKDYKPFWTPVYKEISAKLLSPIEIDFIDSASICSNLLKNKEVKLLPSTMISTKALNNNYQKTCYQLSTSTVVNKWEKEVIKSNVIKTLKIPLQMNSFQHNIINGWINTSNYVYNKTVEKIKSGAQPNWMNLRDALVISKTKKNSNEYHIFDNELNILKQKYRESNDPELKDSINELLQHRRNNVKKIKFEKNNTINDWELNTPKEVRTCAVKNVCSAYKTGFSQLKTGKIKHFNINFKKKTNNNKCITIPKSFISIEYNNNHSYIKMAPTFFKDESSNSINNSLFLISKRTIKKNKNIKIDHDCEIIKKNNKWWFMIPITINTDEKKKAVNYCGVDPGIRTFLTTFGNKDSNEYNYRKKLLDKLNKEIILIKNKTGRNKRIRKKSLTKREEKKSNIINDLHWKSINNLLTKNDVIFYGDIKSHDIVGKSKNKNLNRSFNDMKFYKFKERLQYKALVKNKLVVCVNEAYTSQSCSFCGSINKPGTSKVYNCLNCMKKIDRDINAAKNILMKGLIKL